MRYNDNKLLKTSKKGAQEYLSINDEYPKTDKRTIDVYINLMSISRLEKLYKKYVRIVLTHKK